LSKAPTTGPLTDYTFKQLLRLQRENPKGRHRLNHARRYIAACREVAQRWWGDPRVGSLVHALVVKGEGYEIEVPPEAQSAAPPPVASAASSMYSYVTGASNAQATAARRRFFHRELERHPKRAAPGRPTAVRR
jgi:hypothetical protein